MKRCWDAIPFQNGCDVSAGPVTRPDLSLKVQKRLRWPLALTRGGLVLERLWHAGWPLATVVLTTIALAGFGGLRGWAIPTILGLVALICLVLAARHFVWPTSSHATKRLDDSLTGHPIAALQDDQATGIDDVASAQLWQAHQDRMLGRLDVVHLVAPDLRVAHKDPYALRLIAATGAAVAIGFGPWQSASSVGSPGIAAPVAASWEGWIEPPSYTGHPSLYLDDQPDGALTIPKDSRLTLRRYGDPQALGFGGTVLNGDAGMDPSLNQRITRSGTLSIKGPTARNWTITALEDTAPAIRPSGPLTRQLNGDFTLGFVATDDYGITGGEVIVTLSLDDVTRAHGLSIAPEPRPIVTVDLPLPYRGVRTLIEGVLEENLIKHPYAGLPVTLTFRAEDGMGQMGESQPFSMILPARRFLNPIAKALVEQRRDLLWSRANSRRVSQVLRATLFHPEDLSLPEGLYLQLRGAIRRLEAGLAFAEVSDGVPTELRDEIAHVLWIVAVELEDGQLDDARARMQEAQRRLEQAMRDGATPEELAELLDEFRDAMQDYVDQLAQQDPQDAPNAPQSDNAIELSQSDLDAMMDRIEELMREGRTAEAMEMLDQLRRMMENAQASRNGEGQRPGESARDELRETMRQQQGLSDRAFRDLQEQGQGQDSQAGESQENEGRDGGQGRGQSHDGAGGEQGQNGAGGGQEGSESQGGGGDDPGTSLADRQRALQDQLDAQRRNLPGAGDPAGQAARDALDEAGRAMGQAAEALDQGDIPEALNQQADAMEAMREGLRQFDEAMANQQAREEGQQGGNPGDSESTSTQDPLGRSQTGRGGANRTDNPLGDTDETYRRAEELMQELRRRSGEPDRPELERDYLKRLLDQF